MLGALFGGHVGLWQLYHEVTFDGVNRQIIVNHDATELNVKRDIYSAWKEWVAYLDNSKYTPALRCIGGDPVGPGLFAGDIYFLINDWKIYVDHEVNFDGVVYAEDGSSPFITPKTANVVRSVASNLALSFGQTPAQSAQFDTIQAALAALQVMSEDLHHEAFGRWNLDFAQNTLTLYRANGTVLKVFDLTRTADPAPPAYIQRQPR